MRRSKATSGSDVSAPGPGDGAELLVVNGWRIGFHVELLLQLERLIEAVEEERRRHPERTAPSQPEQILAALRRLMFVDVAADPTRSVYRQGGTLGEGRKHWFRAKFGNGRYRLFFRFRARDKILLFAWVNDRETLRTYGSSTDAYATFRRMLDADSPPDDWDQLLEACTAPETVRRLKRILARVQGRRNG